MPHLIGLGLIDPALLGVVQVVQPLHVARNVLWLVGSTVNQ